MHDFKAWVKAEAKVIYNNVHTNDNNYKCMQ